MAGGNWTTQNKVLPGVYTNYLGKGNNPSITGERGIVALPIVFPWFAEKIIIPIYPADSDKLIADFGSDALPIQEAFKNAALVYLYRLNAGTKATATMGNLKCTAIYSGEYGNRFSVSIENAAGQDGKFYVITWFGTNEVDRQLATKVSELKANNWVSFTKVGEADELAANAGSKLTSGANGAATNSDFVAALSAIETQTVDTVACISNEVDIKNLFISFAKRMIQDEGKYLQVVVPDSTLADFEGVLSVKNGVYLENGTHVTNVMATAYMAGATAACPLTESLSNAAYIGAVDVDTRYTITEQTELAKSGQIVFLPPAAGGNNVIIQKDINTLTTFTETRTYALSKNKIIRTLFAISNQIDVLGKKYYIGKIPNSPSGRDQFQAIVLSFFRELESKGVIRDVKPEDIVVNQGDLIDAVTVNYAVRPVDVMEIFYNTIVIEG